MAAAPTPAATPGDPGSAERREIDDREHGQRGSGRRELPQYDLLQRSARRARADAVACRPGGSIAPVPDRRGMAGRIPPGSRGGNRADSPAGPVDAARRLMRARARGAHAWDRARFGRAAGERPRARYRPNASTTRPRISSPSARRGRSRSAPPGREGELVDASAGPRRPAIATSRSTASRAAPAAGRRRRAGVRRRPRAARGPRAAPGARDDPRLGPGLAQEREAPGDRRVVEAARDDVQAAPLLQRPGGGRQRAAPRARLDDDRGVREPADEPVATRERAAASGWVSGANSLTTAPPPSHDRARRAPGARPGTAARDRRRSPRRSACPRSDGRRVGRAVDAEREAGHDRRAEPGDRVARSAPRSPARPPSADASRPPRRRAARSSDVGVAAHEEDRRRELDPSEPRRVRVVGQGERPRGRRAGPGRGTRSGSLAAAHDRRAAVAGTSVGAAVGVGRAPRRAIGPRLADRAPPRGPPTRCRTRRPAARTTPVPRPPTLAEDDPGVALARRVRYRRPSPRRPPRAAHPSVGRRHVRARAARSGPMPSISRPRASARRSAGAPEPRRLVEVRGSHGRRPVEVRDRAGDPQQAVRAPTGQALPFREQRSPGRPRRRPRRADAPEPAARAPARSAGRPLRAAWRVRARPRSAPATVARRLRRRVRRRAGPARPGRPAPTGRSGRGAGPEIRRRYRSGTPGGQLQARSADPS